MKTRLIEMSGMRFGRLTVIERAESTRSRQATWLCVCDCGNITTVTGERLRIGKTKSCGCLSTEMTRKRSTTHGMVHTRIYRAWRNMITRCTYRPCKSYSDYGARGITVCEEWRNSFETFYAWAITNGYNDSLTIDRVDNSKGYLPSNCKWSTMLEQAQNKRNNHYLLFHGEKLTVTEWSRKIGIKRKTIEYRLKSGWSIENTFLTPLKKGAQL